MAATITMQTFVGPAPWPMVALDGATALPAWWSEGVGGDADRLATVSIPGADGTPVDAWYGLGWAHESLGLGSGCFDLAAGFLGSLGTFTHGDPLVVDVDHDALPEVFSDRVLADSTCTPLHLHDDTQDSVTHATMIDGSGEGLVATGAGILLPRTGELRPWATRMTPDPTMWTLGTLPTATGPVFVVNSGRRLYTFDSGGLPTRAADEWDVAPNNAPVSTGDTDGDGDPELAVILRIDDIDSELALLDARGGVIWHKSDPPDSTGHHSLSGATMADLDADGLYEVITWGSAGLFIREGATGAVLASETSIATRAFWTYPVVADVDADGSAEIVVAGEPAEGLWDNGTNDHLYVVGPAEGRWARTRPVWNQTSYDATTVRDDGVLVRFPRPSWQDYRAWRAQPAHDGDRPDLAPRVGDSCATACEAGGTVELEVIVENLGSMDAPAGTEVVLSTWTEGDVGLVEVARATIDVAIPSMTAAEGIVFSVPWEDWHDARVVDVYGATYGEDGHEECDYVNDRLDVWVDPCGE